MSRVWRTWSVLVLFALGTSLITPLIPLYQDRLGFSDTVVTLFLGCYVAALVPSMLTLGQLSDRIGRKAVLLGAIATLAVAQASSSSPSRTSTGLLIARAIQGLATGAFFGTCTAFLVDAAPPGRTPFVAVLGSVSVRLGLGFGPGIGGLIAQYSDAPLRLPFELHLIAIALAAALVRQPARDGDRPLAPAADAAPGGARPPSGPSSGGCWCPRGRSSRSSTGWRCR